jgi:heterodisulfide reductase subunit A
LAEVESVGGAEGDFTVEIRELPRYVDPGRCIACGLCAEKCPSRVEDDYNQGLGKRTSAHVRYPQAVPLKYLIDPDHCLYLTKGKCRACEKVCPSQAIDFSQQEKRYEIDVGAILLAPGLRPVDARAAGGYGYKRLQNVVTSLEFERILSSTGPYQGHLRRPSDQQEPRKIAFLQCVGSRDGNHPYCSSVCCMAAIKEAIVAKEHAPNLDAAIFFMDLRTHGKEFEPYCARGEKDAGIRLIRSRVHTVEPSGPNEDALKLAYVDGEGRPRWELFDMVVLSLGLEVSEDTVKLAEKMGLALDPDRFAQTGCTAPTRTSRPGIFVCGGFSGPKDIPQSITEASAAASQCAALLRDAPNRGARRKRCPEERCVDGEDPRVGVLVCHCGVNIGTVVDVKAVRDYARTLPGVVYAADNRFTCSEDTQQLIRDAVRAQRLNRIVIAACSPRTHESLFQETLEEAGLNRHLFEFANIRDQVAWVHKDAPREATQKAKDLVRMAVSKACLSEPLSPLRLKVHPSALVIGGGVAGLNVALNLADQGFRTYLVEQDARLGGYAVNLSRTWTGEDVKGYLARLTDQVRRHRNIELFLSTRVKDVKGFVGNFTTTVESHERVRELSHGVTILATGGRPLETEEYLYGQTERVTRWHELERLFEAEPERLNQSDAVAFILCVGSREGERSYCSRVCCTASLMKAVSLKERRPGLDVFIFYRDMRSYGRRERLYRRARELGITFVRYSPREKPSLQMVLSGGREKVRITARDPVLGMQVSVDVDYVNLLTAIVPADHGPVARLFKVPLNQEGFFMEAHAKLRPVDGSTEGVFVCGLAHYPKPIDESIAQAQAAAMRASMVLTQRHVEIEPMISVVDEKRCIGCGLCEASCAFGAMRLVKSDGRGCSAESLPALCKGCGLCAAVCPRKAIDMKGFRDREILAAIHAGGEDAMDLKRRRRSGAGRVTSVMGYRMAGDCYFHSGHSWVSVERGGRLKIGVDDFTTKVLGRPETLRVPPTGALLHEGRRGWVYARGGHEADLVAPVTGRVFEVNRSILAQPEIVSEDPYGRGWLIILEPLLLDRDLRRLLSGEQGLRWMEGETQKLLQLLGKEYERLAATGGEAVPDLFGSFPEVGWDRLLETFFL